MRNLMIFAAIALLTLEINQASAQLKIEWDAPATDAECLMDNVLTLFNSVVDGRFSGVFKDLNCGSISVSIHVKCTCDGLDPIHSNSTIQVTKDGVQHGLPRIVGNYFNDQDKDSKVHFWSDRTTDGKTNTAESDIYTISEPGTYIFSVTCNGHTIRTVPIVITKGKCIDCSLKRFFRDADEDGKGDPNNSSGIDCSPPEGFVPDNTDCNDNDDSVFPGAIDPCGTKLDENCSGINADSKDTDCLKGCNFWKLFGEKRLVCILPVIVITLIVGLFFTLAMRRWFRGFGIRADDKIDP